MGEQSMPELKTWMLDRMEGGGAGLKFFLQFDPGKVDRTLLGVSLSALFSRLLGWTRNGERRGGMAIAEDGSGESAAAAISAAALAAAVSVCFAAMHASGQRPRRPPLPATVLGGSSSASRPRALRAPDDGLKILSSKDESFDNVIHGASIGAGDDEPVIVARVKTTPPHVAGTNADEETERGQSEAEERQETERLRELWLSLVEREQILELRLQELKDLRDQEETVRELEHRVAVAATEARLLQLRVASLQEENGRLRAQLEELDDARVQLASAKEKLREIKARVEEEQEAAAREEAALRAKVAELERGDDERAVALAAEAAALREANAALEEQNIELALRLQEAEQAAASPVNLALEEEMVEEAKQLRETNEALTREIERLRSDHCAHVEELVYLKWVNACLRHELTGDGGALTGGGGGKGAMDLSKSMSFRSSERAKELMLRYGHPGLDPALFSPLHESVYGDELATPARNYAAAERSPDATSVATTTTAAAASPAAAAPGKKKSGTRKFLGNFKKLLPGGGKKKGHSSHGHGDRDSSTAPAPPVPSDEYLEKAMQWLSSTHDVLDVDRSYETTPLSSCDRTPPSSVTTVTPRGGGGRSERVPPAHGEAEPATATLPRSRSDAGASYGREASRYHSLRPDHPAADETGAASSEMREPRRRSEELSGRGAARA